MILPLDASEFGDLVSLSILVFHQLIRFAGPIPDIYFLLGIEQEPNMTLAASIQTDHSDSQTVVSSDNFSGGLNNS